jgi:hypothetical protein
MIEQSIWEEKDIHRLAFEALGSERSQRMAKLLGIENAAKSAVCLSCHGANPPPGAPVDTTFRALAEGVTCVVCHGMAKEWAIEHGAALSDWRSFSRADKESRFGMNDLWNPIRRAELCTSCHVGSVAEGKVVTHAMYAAGHPPLGSIEVAAFGDEQPAHWQERREKSPDVQRLQGFREGELDRSRQLVLGGLVTLKRHAALVADQAAETQPQAAKAPPTWPDFARFDCAACHHDLRAAETEEDLVRFTLAPRGTPGRPRRPIWPEALVPLSLSLGGEAPDGPRAAELGKLLETWDLALDKRPFGDRAAAAAAARSVEAWADREIARLGAEPRVDRDAAEKLLGRIGWILEGTLLDYDSTRQLAWAARSLTRDLARPGTNSREAEALEELDRSLYLTLYRGGTRRPIEESLNARAAAALALELPVAREALRRLVTGASANSTRPAAIPANP